MAVSAGSSLASRWRAPPSRRARAISAIGTAFPGAPLTRDRAVVELDVLRADLQQSRRPAGASSRGRPRPARMMAPPATTALRLAYVPVPYAARLGVAVDHAYALEPHAELVGRDLGEASSRAPGRGMAAARDGHRPVRARSSRSPCRSTRPGSRLACATSMPQRGRLDVGAEADAEVAALLAQVGCSVAEVRRTRRSPAPCGSTRCSCRRRTHARSRVL